MPRVKRDRNEDGDRCTACRDARRHYQRPTPRLSRSSVSTVLQKEMTTSLRYHPSQFCCVHPAFKLCLCCWLMILKILTCVAMLAGAGVSDGVPSSTKGGPMRLCPEFCLNRIVWQR
eukprot:3303955-Rhodomonas_salina.1